MKPFLAFTLLTASLTAASSLGFAQEWDPAPAETQFLERASRAYGTHFAQQLLQKQGLKLDVDKFVEAFRAVAEGKPPLIDDSARSATFTEMADYLSSRPKWEGQRYLSDNLTKEGVKSTASGLQYKVLKEGAGPKPSATSNVTVHYTGKLLAGTVFDSSVERGEPASFRLNQVIAGWTEGLQLMAKGAKYRFFIPAVLAYGEAGSPPKIPGHSTLIFDVELLNFEP